ncbi:MAG: Vitamin B12 import ATP-binding protein BtuD [Chroococcopsis gigantea SAG 12.99]|jgi:ABC-type multidrug transport system ATPase subunit/ABC-type multidrug transport system permease subunit|nr:ATP-binding cassette domain-containing protein [Chlorogloea purpurea SAG 13.99]MDV2999193.1 Vitamin B12 import ATP-binding protein BtuD [Chroococcopsis gigantea SAG 12.99]
MVNPIPNKTQIARDPYIILNNQGSALPSFNLSRSYHKLGRDPQEVDLLVPDDWGVVSRIQSRFKRIGQDYWIYDGKDDANPSSNQLFINNRVITPREGYKLQNGDEIRIGQDPQNWVTITYYNPDNFDSTKPPTQKTVSLLNRSVLLGRDSTATLVLDAPTISRRHATIDRDNQGRYIVKDYSANGVFINGQKVSGEGVLNRGNILRVGPFTFVLQGDDLVLIDQGDNIRLDAENVVKIVRDRANNPLVILNHISLPIEPGQFVAIVGGSGAGKSTLLKTLLGIEVTTSGKVYLNGEDLRNNFNIYRTQIGYVPQFDIVHKDLTVGEVLLYGARLRLPPDLDFQEVIDKNLGLVELTERKNTLVRDLSGGQLKRVSIALELLADPKLFFLDEPTSGLDPGLDKKMMELLGKLSRQGRTIVLVTHATNNIKLCDLVAFLGGGGNLCYFGSPTDCLQYFGVNDRDFADIYVQLEDKKEVELARERFRVSADYANNIEAKLNKKFQTNQNTPKQVKSSVIRQIKVLSQRYFTLTLRDRTSLILYLITAPIGIVLIGLVLKGQDPFSLPDNATLDLASKAAPLALRVLFVISSACSWVGLASSLQEIVKEWAIYTRERLINLGLLNYILSKLAVLGLVCSAQSLLITLTVLIAFDHPNPSLLPWFLGLFITTFLTIFSAINLGLMVSAAVKNITQANSALPLLLIPQIIFAGVLFNLDNIGKYLSWLMISRWSIGAYGVLVGVEKMIAKAQQLNSFGVALPFEDPNGVYDLSWRNLSINWGILGVHTIVYLLITCWLQKRKDIL